MTTNKLHTLADVASALGCSVATVKRRVADGTIPVIRIGPRTMRVNEGHAREPGSAGLAFADAPRHLNANT
jgi:excisionase family DNA binding protein